MTDAGTDGKSPKKDGDNSPRMERSADPTPPAEAFEVVANEIRLDILRALFDVEEPRSFSELRDDAGGYDSGRFNYHLSRLDGRFVRNGDAGYELTFAGRRIVGSIRSGIYTEQVTMDPVDSGRCPFCDGQLRATYEEETVEIQCADCEQTVSMFGAPPTLLDGFDRTELPLALSRWVVTNFQRAVQGFCSNCSGRTRLSSTEKLQGVEHILGVAYTCDVCGLSFKVPAGAVVLGHPDVVAFHHNHGIDIRETLVWEIPWIFEEHATEVNGDPFEVRVTPAMDGDRISLVLDENMSVISVESEP